MTHSYTVHKAGSLSSPNLFLEIQKVLREPPVPNSMANAYKFWLCYWQVICSSGTNQMAARGKAEPYQDWKRLPSETPLLKLWGAT